MIPEKGQRTGVVRVVIHNSDQLISHLYLRGKSEESERERIKKKSIKRHAPKENERRSLMSPYPLTRRRNERDDRGKRAI